MPGTLTGLELALLLVSVAVGVTIQASIGFGYALISAPVLALALPEALPATLIILAFPLTTVMAIRERHDIDVRGFAWITAGRVLGTAAGAALLVAVPSDSLSVLFGSLIILAVALSALGPGFEARPRTRFVAGAASGTMGTAAAIGGPALALVYQDRPGPELRSTLALSFEVGQVLALGALMIAGQVHLWHLLLAAELVPAMVVGLLAGPFVARRVDRRWLRPAVLAFAGAAGVAAIVKGLVG